MFKMSSTYNHSRGGGLQSEKDCPRGDSNPSQGKVGHHPSHMCP